MTVGLGSVRTAGAGGLRPHVVRDAQASSRRTPGAKDKAFVIVELSGSVRRSSA